MSSQTLQEISSNMQTEVSGLPKAFSNSDKTDDQILNLNSDNLAEIQTALEDFKALKRNAYEVDATTFPLPTFGPRLKAIAKKLHEGTEFFLLRGFNTNDYSDEDNMIIFLGLGSYIGSERGAQNKSRVMISHITDAKEWQDVPHEKRHGIHTNSALPFHNDMGCEILTLLYRRVAARGGATSLASAEAIYRDLLKQHAILETLKADNWPVQLSVKDSTFGHMPLLACRDGHVIISADPGRLGLHPATGEQRPEGSRLKAEQVDALKELNQLAEKHAISIPAQDGDILFINNLTVLHKRDSYVDADEDADAGTSAGAKKANGSAPNGQVAREEDAKTGGDKPVAAALAKRRWLMRLWLRNKEHGWEIPEEMKLPWEAAYGKGVGRLIEPKYDPSPQPDYKEPQFTSGTAAWLIEDDKA